MVIIYKLNKKARETHLFCCNWPSFVFSSSGSATLPSDDGCRRLYMEDKIKLPSRYILGTFLILTFRLVSLLKDNKKTK